MKFFAISADFKINFIKIFGLFCLIFLFSCKSMFFKEEIAIPPDYSELLNFRGVILYGGSGLSISEPIIVKGARSAFCGMQAVERYLDKNYPGYIISNQYLLEVKNKGRILDCVEIFVLGGVKKKLYFDITEFYEK